MKYIPNHPKLDKSNKHYNWVFIGDCLFWLIKEMLKTFSNEPSFFSSKRLEKFYQFSQANLLLILTTKHLVATGKMDVTLSLMIYTAQMIYAGFNTKQMFTEKKHNEKVTDES